MRNDFTQRAQDIQRTIGYGVACEWYTYGRIEYRLVVGVGYGRQAGEYDFCKVRRKDW